MPWASATFATEVPGAAHSASTWAFNASLYVLRLAGLSLAIVSTCDYVDTILAAAMPQIKTGWPGAYSELRAAYVADGSRAPFRPRGQQAFVGDWRAEWRPGRLDDSFTLVSGHRCRRGNTRTDVGFMSQTVSPAIGRG